MDNFFINNGKHFNFILFITICIGLLVIGLLWEKEFVHTFGFSLCFILMTLTCFSWWYNPIHPFPYYYFSPHSILLTFSYLYLCLGNLPIMVTGEEINPGASNYYLPTMWLAFFGLFSFDITYRFFTKLFFINKTIALRVRNFSEENKQIKIYSFSWYILVLIIFVYMMHNFLIIRFSFVGASRFELTNIFEKSGASILFTTWCFLSLSFFITKKQKTKILIAGMLLTLLPILINYQDRRQVLYCLLSTFIAYLLIRKRSVNFRFMFAGIIALTMFFLLATSMKLVTIKDKSVVQAMASEKNIYISTKQIFSSKKFLDLDLLKEHLALVFKMRLVGIDWPACIMQRHYEYGIPLLEGNLTVNRALKAVPRVIWPAKYEITEQIEGYDDFNITRTDQPNTIFSSLYMDWGTLGVLLGFPLLAFMLCFIQLFVFVSKKGMLIYLGTLWSIFITEQSLFAYPIMWIRWMIVVVVINAIFYFLYELCIKGIKSKRIIEFNRG